MRQYRVDPGHFVRRCVHCCFLHFCLNLVFIKLALAFFFFRACFFSFSLLYFQLQEFITFVFLFFLISFQFFN